MTNTDRELAINITALLVEDYCTREEFASAVLEMYEHITEGDYTFALRLVVEELDVRTGMEITPEIVEILEELTERIALVGGC